MGKSPPSLSQHSSAHREDYQQFLSSGTLTRLLVPPPARTATLRQAAQIPPLLHRAAVRSDPGTKMAICSTAAPNLISMEIVSSLSSLCACSQGPLRCMYDPADQSGSEEKATQSDIICFLPHSETSVCGCYSQSMRQKDSHSSLKSCFRLCCVLSPTSSSLSVVKREAQFKGSPSFILLCRLTPNLRSLD